jgi:unsaturated chondroitin disaccharide hydrolase
MNAARSLTYTQQDHTTMTHPVPTSANLQQAINGAVGQIQMLMSEFHTDFPCDTTVQQFYPPRRLDDFPSGANVGWTSGFWPGMLWMAHELTRAGRFREAAESFLPSFATRLAQRVDLNHHDLGFLYIPTCIAAFKLTGNEDAARVALGAADCLMERYLPAAGIIQAWGDLNDPAQRGRIIIDCLMNMPLLHWASEYSGNPRYREAALSHLERSQQFLVRADDSSFHTYHFDPVDGRPLYGSTHQGHTDDSAWARGQAWGVYGFALNHRRAPDMGMLDTAKRQAAYFLKHLPSDRVAYWDLCFGEGSDEPRDSSASAIAACGLMEIADQLPAGEERDYYMQQARELVQALIVHCAGARPVTSGLLRHGVYHKHGNRGIDEANLWGDYYYLEALARLQIGWKPYC